MPKDFSASTVKKHYSSYIFGKKYIKSIPLTWKTFIELYRPRKWRHDHYAKKNTPFIPRMTHFANFSEPISMN